METSGRGWSARAVAAGIAMAVLAPVLGAGAASAQASPADPGGSAWQQVPRAQVAEECDLDPSLLAAADRRFPDGYSVVRYGKLCWTGGNVDQPFTVFSVTKTFGAVLTGMVAARSSLDDTDLASEWLSNAQMRGVNPQATVAHMMGMTSTSSNLDPGRKNRFAYDTTGSREINTLIEVMDNVIAREPQNFGGARNTAAFARQMFATLGMERSSWGGAALGYTLEASVNDLSRLGLLLLRKGEWNGEQLIEEEFVYRMTHPSFADSNTGLGYLTWLNAEGMGGPSGRAHGTCAPYAAWPSDPPFTPAFPEATAGNGNPLGEQANDIGVFWAAGMGGQWTTVHRGLDLVITGRNVTGGGNWALWDAVRPALVALDDTYAGDERGFCAAYLRGDHAPTLLSPWGEAPSQPTEPAEPGEPTEPAPPAQPAPSPWRAFFDWYRSFIGR
jgi:hypothetical protein